MMMMMFVLPSPRCVGLYIHREIGQSAWSSLNRCPKISLPNSVITDVMKDVYVGGKSRDVKKKTERFFCIVLTAKMLRCCMMIPIVSFRVSLCMQFGHIPKDD